MKLHEEISNWLGDYLKESNLESFVIGISGGIDSALTSTLCAKTGLKTIVVSLPIHQNKEQLLRAYNHIEWLKKQFSNVEYINIDLTQTFESFKSLFESPSDLSLANSRSRLRMITLYQIASTNNGLVVGTGNKIEDFGVGFFTKYGDGGVDISPIADLTKTEVRQISKELGVIEEILIAKPTDGLWEDDRTDEEQIGATYEKLENIINLIGENSKEDVINNISGRKREVLKIYLDLNKKNKHKMIPIPIFKK